MPKRAVLKDKLQEKKSAPAPVKTTVDKQALRNGGRGHLVGVHVNSAAYKVIRRAAVEHDLKHNELLRQAINDWLLAHDFEPLA